MARVNVMTAITGNKSPAQIERVGMWMVEVIDDGFPITYQGMLKRESITGRELTLQLLANGLTKLRKLEIEFEEIAMYFDCQVVESAFLNKWIERWSEQDWKNAKGEEIADKDTWMMIWNLLTSLGKRYIAPREKSSYENWMHDQIEKAIKNDEKR